MSGISLRGVSKRYGSVDVVHGVDIEIDKGEFCVFVGPSGCGKTTLLRMIAGLEEISGGDIFIDGRRVNGIDPARRGAAMVFQNYALYPHMTVEQNMGFGLRMNGHPRAEVATRVKDAARLLQIQDLLTRKPRQLSGGQRQRVAIGRAIVRNPQVFLFDEPLSNLDAELRAQTRVELAKLHHQLAGSTMVYVTHDQVEAMTLADKIVVLRAGVVEQIGAPMELYESPANIFVAGFIGSPKMNFVNVSAERDALRLDDGSQLARPQTKTAPQRLGVRADQLTIIDPEKGAIRGEVSVVERLGDSELVHVRTAWEQEIVVRVPGGTNSRVGSTVGLALAGRVHFFDAEGQAITVTSQARTND
ncbi:MAG TPA: sn-glycerol-3-phosphate ABC transporter ATP-binding protein UgpC [Rhizobiaceae bacterium]|nr:sn-glycerol-3-phosphate ABC transporter ATP-binding protein UgpC [Rhizobiaceae bacterium]